MQSAALLTPYNGQVRQLRTELDSRNFLFRDDPSRELVVSTVDGFQVKFWAEIMLPSALLRKPGCCSAAGTWLTSAEDLCSTAIDDAWRWLPLHLCQGLGQELNCCGSSVLPSPALDGLHMRALAELHYMHAFCNPLHGACK